MTERSPIHHARDLEPAGWFEELRDNCPVHLESDHEPPFYVVSRFADVVEMLKQPDVWRNGDGPGIFFQDGGVLGSADDPDHARQRRALRASLLPGAIAGWEERIRALADEMIDTFVDAGEGDLVELFAFPFPALVVGELLGVEPRDREDFKRWSTAVVNALGGGDLAAYEEATRSIWRYVELRAVEREALLDAAGAPNDDAALGTVVPNDVISRMVLAHRRGELSRTELRRLGHQLLVAGHETTTSLIGLLLYRLVERPELLAQIRADPSLIEAAIEECLRFDSPVQGLFRTNVCPATVGGQEIATGTKVEVLFGSANRDPQRWGDPDEFRLDRPAQDQRTHVGFGWGVHHCIGAPLARLETKVAFERLLPRLAEIELTAPPEVSETFILRGFTTLRLRWRPAGRASG